MKRLKTYYLILKLISENYSLKEISKKLNISKQLLNYYITKLKQKNLIKVKLKSSITLYELTEEGAKFYINLKKQLKQKLNKIKPNFTYHNLQIKYKILKIENDKIAYDKIVNLKKTIQKIKIVNEFPFQFTLKNINDKTILVYLHQQKFDNINEFYSLFLRFTIFLYHYLQKNGIFIDPIGEVINQHISIHLPKNIREVLDKISEGKTIEVKLNRKAKAPLDLKTELDAKVWLDKSLGEVELETNDIKYLENFILMPERIEKITNLIMYSFTDFSNNLKEHTNAIKKLNELLNKLNEILENKEKREKD